MKTGAREAEMYLLGSDKVLLALDEMFFDIDDRDMFDAKCYAIVPYYGTA